MLYVLFTKFCCTNDDIKISYVNIMNVRNIRDYCMYKCNKEPRKHKIIFMFFEGGKSRRSY